MFINLCTIIVYNYEIVTHSSSNLLCLLATCYLYFGGCNKQCIWNIQLAICYLYFVSLFLNAFNGSFEEFSQQTVEHTVFKLVHIIK